MKAVVSCVSGGLGNQLLQFAAGYGLARRLGCAFDLDISSFDNASGSGFSRKFQLEEIIPRGKYRYTLRYSHFVHLRDLAIRAKRFSVDRPYRRGVPFWNSKIHTDEPFEEINCPVAIQGVPSLTNAIYDSGGDILDMISSGLPRRNKMDTPAKYAFVHVRLGDFVSNPHVAKNMVYLYKGYYAEAMKAYEHNAGKTEWSLLSDEPDKAIQRLPGNFSINCDHRGTEFEDLSLMARSAGSVIANSTFSYWAGLLSEYHGGTVIAPSVWRRGGRPTPKLPDTWLRI